MVISKILRIAANERPHNRVLSKGDAWSYPKKVDILEGLINKENVQMSRKPRRLFTDEQEAEVVLICNHFLRYFVLPEDPIDATELAVKSTFFIGLNKVRKLLGVFIPSDRYLSPSVGRCLYPGWLTKVIFSSSQIVVSRSMFSDEVTTLQSFREYGLRFDIEMYQPQYPHSHLHAYAEIA